MGLLALDKVLVIPEDRLDAAFFVYHCSLIVFAVNLISIPFNACVIAHEKMNFFAIISIAESIFKLLIAYLLFASPFDTLKTYAVLLCLLSTLMLICYGIYCRINFP